MTAGAPQGAVTDAHTAWLLRYCLVPEDALERHHSYALPALIADAYPQAGHEGLSLLVDMLGWFTIIDDHFDGPAGRDPAAARGLIRSFLDAMDPAPPAGDPVPAGVADLPAAWRDLWHRQRAAMPVAWSRRAARDWARCLTTFVTETGHRAAATTPTVRQAVLLRRHASCLYPFTNMLEWVRGNPLPEEVHAEPELRLLRAHIADTATLVNDLYSLEREERQCAPFDEEPRCAPFNMITVLRREQRMSRDAAISTVRAEIDRLSLRSDILRSRLAAHHPEAGWYLRETRRLVDGVRRWSSTTSRYSPT
ncbi:terpene synthase family protein [Streptomyces sp. NRRL F-5126]|uniref:terpene synthase family protein n=1 Tax=Streptomyces sp. NRRL F-5126 TaxID=1463857 RepID=UPI0004C818A9|nr:terpene synthase family protein [Streptomyces sp. NRRL F-5126]